jgi:NAD+ synthase (glutamine-hydrolysing)
VLAALASDAMGPLHVHALVGASAGTYAPACRELAKRLHIDQRDAAGQPRDYDVRDLDELELAALAREQNALVLSPFDKTELALGSYGRHVSCAGLCPLGDVYRSDVLDMAHVRNTISPIFRRVRLSESEMLTLTLPDGSLHVVANEADVVRVDEIVSGYVEYDRPLAELAAASDDGGALAQAVLREQRLAEPWRRTLPPVLAMSTHTLDDARFPLGVSWHDTHLEDVTDAALESMLPAPKREANPEAEPHPAEFDLDATLAMLRDLAEQGGLLPPALARGDNAMGGLGGSMGSDGKPLGWMNPFSEN